MSVSKLFESEEGDVPVWSGQYNGTVIEIFNREDTGAEEVYAGIDDGDMEYAATNLAAFLDSTIPEDFGAFLDPNDPTTVIITINDEPYTQFALEIDETTGEQFVVTDIQLDNEEMAYLVSNGTLPDPDEFDYTDPENPEDDLWNGE